MGNETSKISQEQIDGNIVNSVAGPSVNQTDPKNPTIPEIPSVVDVANKANKNGSNTEGGAWFIDSLMSDLLARNNRILRVLTSRDTIEYGNEDLIRHLFVLNEDANNLMIRLKNGDVGYIWNTLNLNPSDFLSKEGGIVEGVLNYQADFSGNYTDRSLVDKAYVDSKSGKETVIIGDDTSTYFEIPHQLNSIDVLIRVTRLSDGIRVHCASKPTNENTIVISLKEPPSKDDYQVDIFKIL